MSHTLLLHTCYNYNYVIGTSSVSESVRLIISSDDLGRRVFEGVVEILYDGRWGVLCRGSMDTEIAGSVCEGLGYERNHASLVTYSSQK